MTYCIRVSEWEKKVRVLTGVAKLEARSVIMDLPN